MKLTALVSDVRVWLSLQPAEAGAVLMQLLHSIPPDEIVNGRVHIGKCISGDNLEAYPRDTQDSARKVAAEGWAWLVNEGLVVLDPDASVHGQFLISRKG